MPSLDRYKTSSSQPIGLVNSNKEDRNTSCGLSGKKTETNRLPGLGKGEGVVGRAGRESDDSGEGGGVVEGDIQ